MYMLDSDQEPSYNLSNNLLLLHRILKLIEDMVDDSTPLIYVPINDGAIVMENAQGSRKDKTLPTNFIVELLAQL